MKKSFFPLLAACLLLSGCSGLPTAREMGDMALLRTLGVDASPKGVAVTGSTGPRVRGLQAEGEPALTVAADQASLSGACLAMQGQSDSFVFFGYVDQLLIGEELARQDIQPVLDYFARDVELGLGAQLWLVRDGTARDAVSSGGDEGVDSRLETLQTDGKMGIAAHPRTAGEVYTDLLEQGSTYVPALTLGQDALAEQGYGIIRENTLAGFLEGEDAVGLELLAGGPVGDILDVELSGNQVSVKLTSACTRSRLEFQGDVPSALKLACRIEARLAEYQRRPGQRELETLGAAVERQVRSRMEGALNRLQGLQADCIGLGARAAISCPARWQGLQEEWAAWFARIPVELQIQVTILD